MKIGILGLGFVGGSMFKSFKLKGIDCIGYDKYKKIGNFENVLDTDILFLCLPTLFDEEKNNYNKDEIIESLEKIKNYQGFIVIKSTIEPETTDELSVKFPKLKIIHNPEFLTARTAFEDFHYQKHIVIGKGPNCESVDILKEFYKKNYPEAEISVCTSLESESMKIFCNSFYASKVMLFNEYYLLCQKNGSNFNTIKDLMLKNNWINPMHTNIPGPDGKLGYGGACFPKDTKALNEYMKSLYSENEVLQGVIEECELIREIKKKNLNLNYYFNI
jgi:nucleotide sugar dehydrogenase